jgi:single-stranded DNA-binding protein
MNVVTLIGNLATEVELREVGPDKRVASFVLAVDRASQDGGADFVRVSAWDRQAELCAEYLGRGGGSRSTGGSSPGRGRTRGNGAARSRWSPGGSSSSAAGLGASRRKRAGR